jgi:uncharacterized OB-fold protein
VRRVVRVAAYVPAGASNWAAVAASDEDSFTLAATAVERVWSGRRAEPGPILVHALGDFPEVVEWGFAALLGRETVVTRSPGTASQLAKALEELEGGEGGPAIVVAVDLAETSASRTSSKSGIAGDAAVAFLLEPTESAAPLLFGKHAAGRSAVAATVRRARSEAAGGSRIMFVGDWDRGAGVGSAREAKPAGRDRSDNLGTVSEGAYIPRARYLENLPSRWRFLAEVCEACHRTTFPSRRVCRNCGRADSLTPVELPYNGGRVVAVTTVSAGGQPTEFDAQVAGSGPYDVALVELARGMRVTLQVTDIAPGTLAVGDHVDTLLRRLYPMEGEWRYGRKAVPVSTAGSRGPAKTPA